MNLIYKKSEWVKDRDEIEELCGTWWEDSLFYKLYGIKYKVDMNLFETMNKSGALIYTVGRDVHGKLISCYVGIKSPYIFNTEIITASEIVWCIRKEYRNFKNLVSLIKAIQTLMEEENIFQWNLNVSNEKKYDSTGSFLESKKYAFMDKCFTKLKGE